VYSFSNTTVISRVGVSWISSTKACANVNAEIPRGTALQSVVSATKQVWNSKLLGKVTTTEVKAFNHNNKNNLTNIK
jgi:putative alpha-1,2-mannosidase